MVTITFSEQDIMRAQAIVMDNDKEDALAFIRECMIQRIEKGERMRLKSHLDGGKGSMF